MRFWLAALMALAFLCGVALVRGPSAAGASKWKGTDPTCSVVIPGGPNAPVRKVKFMTCPPKRVLLLGDSLALTMGLEMGWHEQNWGVVLDDQALNGCGFITDTRLETGGRFLAENAHCNTEVAQWSSAIAAFKPQAIVVEMGWWDSEVHQINGATTQLGAPAYDTELEQAMVATVHQLQAVTKAPIFLLSVPWMNPAVWPNGQIDPAASPASHAEVNSLLASAAQADGATLIDVAKYLTPSGTFEASVDGQPCRAADGVHLDYQAYTKCGAALAGGVFSTVRQALKG